MQTDEVPTPHAEPGSCGAHGKQKNRPCRHPAGFRTDHPGEGRCWLHGGRTPVRSGRYSRTIKSFAKRRFARLYEDFRLDQDLEDLGDEVAVSRVLLAVLPELVPATTAGEHLQRVLAMADVAARIGLLAFRRATISVMRERVLSENDKRFLIEAITRAVGAHVPDPETLVKIGSELREILSLPRSRNGHTNTIEAVPNECSLPSTD